MLSVQNNYINVGILYVRDLDIQVKLMFFIVV